MNKEEKSPDAYRRKCLDLLAKARLQALHKGPYFSGLLYTLVPILVPGLGSIAVTDEMLLLVDPIRVVDDPELGGVDNKGIPHKLAGVLIHECMHILRGMDRVLELAKVDGELANIAADLPINYDLKRAEWQLPNWVVYPEKLGLPEEKTMEQYFELLRQNPDKSKQDTRKVVAEAKGTPSKEKSSGKSGGKSSGKGNKSANGSKDDDSQSGLDVGAGQCGSAAGNQSQAATDAANQHKDKGRSQTEKDAARKKTLSDVKRHISQGRGSAPGWLEEELGKLQQKRRDRDWVKELNQVVRRHSGAIMAGGSDFSMARPSRRSLLRGGLLRPGLIEQQYEAALAIDTSGSMGEEQLNYAKNVLLNIMAQTGLDTIWLTQCDTRVQMPFTRTRIRDIPNMKMKGRGGTDFCPIFQALRKLKPRPDMIVVVTDGDGPAPDKAPYGMTTIWVIVPSSYRRRPATWGHLIVCSNDHSVNDAFS